MTSSSTKVVVLATCFAAMLAAAFIHHSLVVKPESISSEIVEEYTRWRATYKAGLTMSPNEQNYRLKMFAMNREHIQKLNEQYARRVVEENLPKPKGDMFELNMSADLSDEEFQAQYLGGVMANEEEEEVAPASEYFKAHPEVKAVKKPNLGAVDSYNVYNQGSCGSCWAFGSVNLAERKWFNTYGSKAQLSQQQLVDCDSSCNGCSGGLISRGMTYINSNGVSMASEYPYKASVGSCRQNQVKRYLQNVFNIQTYTFDIKGVDSWISKGNYAGGRVNGQALRYASRNDDIYSPSSSDCTLRVNHAIILVASSLRDNYVTMLNSWGTTWGYNGVKKIKPCGTDNYAGAGAQFYTY